MASEPQQVPMRPMPASRLQEIRDGVAGGILTSAAIRDLLGERDWLAIRVASLERTIRWDDRAAACVNKLADFPDLDECVVVSRATMRALLGIAGIAKGAQDGK